MQDSEQPDRGHLADRHFTPQHEERSEHEQTRSVRGEDRSRLEAKAVGLVIRLMGSDARDGHWETRARELLVSCALHVCDVDRRLGAGAPRVMHRLLSQAEHLRIMLARARREGACRRRVARTCRALLRAKTSERAIVTLLALAHLKKWMASQRLAGTAPHRLLRESPLRIRLALEPTSNSSIGHHRTSPLSHISSDGTARCLVATHFGDPDAVSIRSMPDPLFGPARRTARIAIRRRRTPRRSGGWSTNSASCGSGPASVGRHRRKSQRFPE